MADKQSLASEAKKVTRSTSSGQAVDKLIEEIGGLSVLELSELVKGLQEKLGVSGMPVVSQPAAGVAPAQEGGGGEAATASASTATVVLANAGENKIGVIKALREINPQLGLKEAKDITEATPKEILTAVKMEEAKVAKEKLEAAGAKVDLK